MPRFHCPAPLVTGATLELPAGAARHVQVLRLQPGDHITLFHGGQGDSDPGGEFEATVLRMGRSDVLVQIGAHHAIEREAPRAVHLLAGITANERMDWLVEKATELGVASITPLVAERSVLKLKGERAEKKIAHWQAVAVAASEQCGRNRVPVVHSAIDLAGWVRAQAAGPGGSPAGSGPRTENALRLLLSLRAGSVPFHTACGLGPVAGDNDNDNDNDSGNGNGSDNGKSGSNRVDKSNSGERCHHGPRFPAPVWFLSGPEGGLSPSEEDLAVQHGFAPVTLGPRTLRAETAPLAALAALSLTGH